MISRLCKTRMIDYEILADYQHYESAAAIVSLLIGQYSNYAKISYT